MNLLEIGETLAKKFQSPKQYWLYLHYEREDICVTSNDTLKTIHYFYGFPRQLYNKKYDCPGSKELVIKIKDLIENEPIPKPILF